MLWDDALFVGNETLDGEHRGLFETAAAYREALEAGVGREVLCMTIDRLVVHAVLHFRHEEALFIDAGYPAAARHKAEHEILTQRLLDLQGKTRFGVTDELAMELDAFFKDWILEHVLVTDKAMVSYLRGL